LQLLLENPGLAKRSCGDCQKYIYIEDGPHKNKRATRGGVDILRNRGSKPNCKACPKKSPAQAWKYSLSLRSQTILKDYWRGKATNGASFGFDGVQYRTSHLLSLCERIVSTENQASQMKMFMTLLQRSSIS
tara:strand:- start:930 stop:1325 length:396 start_codon:yes stop_codon:yes gene_type:complete